MARSDCCGSVRVMLGETRLGDGARVREGHVGNEWRMARVMFERNALWRWHA